MSPARYKGWIDTTVLSPISGHHCHKNLFPLIRGVRFFKSCAIFSLFSETYYFYTYIWGSQAKWEKSGSLWTKKRKKEIMLNYCNLKCFKTKYQLVKSHKLYSNIKQSLIWLCFLLSTLFFSNLSFMAARVIKG